MLDLTLIIPTKKEVESLPIFLKEIENFNCKKIIVLQKEDLETKIAIEKIKNIKVVEQVKNGYGNALIEGINSVETKYCCIINADGSMNPKYLSEMRKLCENKDLVFHLAGIKGSVEVTKKFPSTFLEILMLILFRIFIEH